LRFYYLDNQKEFPQVANIIKSSLETYWIYTEIIPVSISDVNNKVLNWKKRLW
jgi:hypothetical protein